MKDVSVCPICQSAAFQPILICKDHTVSHEDFTIATCTNCNFRVTTPAPADQDLANYYQSDNYISHTSKATSLIDRLYLLARRFTLNWKFQVIKHAITNQTTPYILDYGCGTGDFLKTCKSRGWKIEGIETSEPTRIKAETNCHQNIACSINEISNKQFHIISLWHVLEHISELNMTLSAIRNKLHEEGRLVVALPNPNSMDAQHYKKDWAAYDVPRHLWHFSQQNVEHLLNNNGFKIVSKVPMLLDAFYVCLLSEKYKENNKTQISGIMKAVILALKSNLKARSTTEYSSIIYIAKK